MRNLSFFTRAALRLSLGAQRAEDIGGALSPFTPMGYVAGVQRAGESVPAFFCGGQAVYGGTEVTERTIFRIASISKVIGAAAAMRLVRKGKLSLDGDIAEVLGFPISKTITLRQLLTHTASLSDMAYDRAIESGTLPPLPALLSESFLSYAPGTRFRYSNFGAGIAGMLVEKASGMLFDDFIRQEFFAPDGMDASFHPQRIAHKERLANCYRMPGGSLAYDAREIARQPLDDIPCPELHYTVPAGRLLIAAPDLLRLLRRLRTEDREIFTPQNSIGSVRFDVGRGLGTAFVPQGVFSVERAFWGHQGTAYGAASQAWIDLEDGLCAVLLTNGARLSSIGPLQRVGQRGIAALVKGK